ncbi:MAG TPA: NAD+ synthase [Bacteroidales bacterium]|nr:NAD+ synthase [Bacteroidales bacterium]
MRIALAQLNFRIGDFETNTTKIIQAIDQAEKQGAELIVFAELALCGYPPLDFLEFDDFIFQTEISLQKIADHCTKVAAIIGSPCKNTAAKGKPLFNSAVFCYRGRMEYFHKGLLPNYDVFDEYRYFEPAKSFKTLHFKGLKIALTICEDIWDLGQSRLYTIDPMEELAKDHPDLMINIAASPFHYHQAVRRHEVLKANVEKYRIPLIYVNHVGAQTELIFDGGSASIGADGRTVMLLPYFHEALEVVDTEELINGESSIIPAGHNKISLIHDALVLGISDYFRKMGFSRAVLGLSGGIDSAVTMVLAAKALGASNVTGLLMPSEFSSSHSVEDALALANNLGSPHQIIPISPSYHVVEQSLEPIFAGTPFGLTEENIQARLRGLILMAFANKFNHILLNTSNKSEAAVGYGTLYGDMNGGLSVLGDVYKTEVYQLARYINSDEEVIPLRSITKPPSAELRPNQLDSDSLPEYDVLDELLYAYIEQRRGPGELISMGFDATLVSRVLRLVNTNEYKRKQTPPILRISPKAFGMGRRMPIVAKYLS